MESGREFTFEVTGTSLKVHSADEDDEGKESEENHAVMLLASDSARETAQWVSAIRVASRAEEIKAAVESRKDKRKKDEVEAKKKQEDEFATNLMQYAVQGTTANKAFQERRQNKVSDDDIMEADNLLVQAVMTATHGKAEENLDTIQAEHLFVESNFSAIEVELRKARFDAMLNQQEKKKEKDQERKTDAEEKERKAQELQERRRKAARDKFKKGVKKLMMQQKVASAFGQATKAKKKAPEVKKTHIIVSKEEQAKDLFSSGDHADDATAFELALAARKRKHKKEVEVMETPDDDAPPPPPMEDGYYGEEPPPPDDGGYYEEGYYQDDDAPPPPPITPGAPTTIESDDVVPPPMDAMNTPPPPPITPGNPLNDSCFFF